ncbi:MAG: hypothetical protein AAGC53_03630 [Actinomycetota bacterium]
MTSPDETRHEATLTRKQELALDCLIGGGTVTATSDAAGVSRQTVSHWSNHDHDFQLAFNERRIDLNKQTQELVRTLDIAALDLLGTEVANGNVDAALQWVKSRKLSVGYLVGPVQASGPSTTTEPSGADTEPQSPLEWADGLLH